MTWLTTLRGLLWNEFSDCWPIIRVELGCDADYWTLLGILFSKALRIVTAQALMDVLHLKVSTAVKTEKATSHLQFS